MATLYTLQGQNARKTWYLMTIFLVIVIGIGWVFAQAYNSSEVLYIFILIALGMNLFSYWYSDKIVLSMAGAREARRDEFFDLYTVVENLSITAGLPKPKVYVVNDSAPNAFATGRNKEHAVVCVTTGLLKILDRAELEGVIAHELSHIGNRDILLQTVVVVLVGFIAIISDFFLRSQMFGGRDDRDNNGNVFMIVGIVFAILSPLVAMLMQLAISRRREYQADASGALLTRYPEGLARALEKIGGVSHGLRHAHNATAHMYISNPFGSKTLRGVSKMFMTHPPMEDRVRILREMSI
ncbi:MAG: M48 family metalloprotease [Candidatus Vogelbacteria bacterium]|nr:M48 family metalloprotease [Candidatus Vogelbacteria bacterium]